MNNHKLLVCLLLLLVSLQGAAQTGNGAAKTDGTNMPNPVTGMQGTYQRAGKFFLFWGYNRSAYSRSRIHFKGEGYDFTIKDIRASDDPTNVSSVYVGPTTFTIPQFNYRIGYFINDNTFISFGSDHMKYTIVKQTTRLTGTITKGNNIGTYNNTEVVVGENSKLDNRGPSVIDDLPGGFVSEFEHCDGLNDFSLEVGKLNNLWISRNKKHSLAVTGTAGLGFMLPDTDADILGQPPKHDMEEGKKAYHMAGYSVNATIGLQADFFKHVFLLARLKGAYINMPDINTTVFGGKASQHFTVIEPMVVLGYTFHL